MPNKSPWDDISIPDSDFNVRQIAASSSVSCFWGRDIHGSCLFIMELEGEHTTQFRKNVTKVKGIEVDLRDGGIGIQRFLLVLEQEVDRDLFESLCSTLVTSLTQASDSASSLAIALSHIRRWKLFLMGRGNHLLSAEEVRGLFAELIFLLELMDYFATEVEAISAWLGPEKSHQDFIFGNTAVEIKSLSGAERSSVRISSEDQLESLKDSLFLRIYRLSSSPDSKQAQSLNEIIAKIQSKLANPDAFEEFDRKLAEQGYAPLPEYDEPRFLAGEVRTYHVKNGFPRLMRSLLPVGVMKVNYEIKLETISAYLCDNEILFGSA